MSLKTLFIFAIGPKSPDEADIVANLREIRAFFPLCNPLIDAYGLNHIPWAVLFPGKYRKSR